MNSFHISMSWMLKIKMEKPSNQMMMIYSGKKERLNSTKISSDSLTLRLGRDLRKDSYLKKNWRLSDLLEMMISSWKSLARMNSLKIMKKKRKKINE